MRARLACALAAGVLLTACPDDIPDECRPTCETCCSQEESCLGSNYDACFTACFDGCQRAYALYRSSSCFESKLASKECICALSCTDLADWEAGTADHCSAELDQEEQDCSWF